MLDLTVLLWSSSILMLTQHCTEMYVLKELKYQLLFLFLSLTSFLKVSQIQSLKGTEAIETQFIVNSTNEGLFKCCRNQGYWSKDSEKSNFNILQTLPTPYFDSLEKQVEILWLLQKIWSHYNYCCLHFVCTCIYFLCCLWWFKLEQLIIYCMDISLPFMNETK